MTEEKTRSFPFPDVAADGDVVFKGELVCEYHASTNTWECWRHNREAQRD